ncbi:MAG: amidohydrolase family protein [Nannocystaceae bacterium]|nr:amidohydrolase family protein [bacterium]
MAGSLHLRGGSVVTMDAQRRVVTSDVLIVDGVITAVGDAPVPEGVESIDVSGHVVLPGFIQGHVHLGQSLLRGLSEGRELMDWLRERIWPLEAGHTHDSAYWSAMLGAADCIRSGTTTIQEIGLVTHMDALFEGIRDSGLRAIAGKCLMDTGLGVSDVLIEPPDAAEAAFRDQHARWHGYEGRIESSLCPRFILSCSTALWERTVALASEFDLPVHTHLLEHPREEDEVREVLGESQMGYLDRLGVLDTDLRIAHGVQLNDEHLEILAGRTLSVCHCPSANLKLGSGIAHLGFLGQAQGVRVGIGTDGAPCNNDMDILEEIRLAALLQGVRQKPGAFSAEAALALATCDGAAAIGKADSLGSVEVGKQGDVVVLDLERPGSFGPCSSVYDRIVYGAARDAVRHVAVAGTPLLRDGALTTIDEAQTMARAGEEVRALVERVL